ncbi:MAG: polysaccharide deacetylase [Tardiphaga sp.]|nr:polysaccharide deacetylase [Tardiphaga sp.]
MTHGTIGGRLKADLIWASGWAGLSSARGWGPSALIGFDRVRPVRRDPFQPRRHLDITPLRLERLIRALKRWRVDIVSIDEACARLVDDPSRRFVSLSFNGSYRDIVTSAHPVLARHRVPFTVYVPSAFPDRIAEPWWLALEIMIRQHTRINLVIDRKQTFFGAESAATKYQLYERLYGWMRGLPPAELSAAINDLYGRYGVALVAPARDDAISWDDIALLAADPLATIGSMTVNHPALANLPDDAARRDIAMGRAVLESALQRPVRHFAFPFGDATSFGRPHVEMARAAGFTSAVTTIPAAIGRAHDALCLPRLIWNDAMPLRDLRVRLAGY